METFGDAFASPLKAWSQRLATKGGLAELIEAVEKMTPFVGAMPMQLVRGSSRRFAPSTRRATLKRGRKRQKPTASAGWSRRATAGRI